MKPIEPVVLKLRSDTVSGISERAQLLVSGEEPLDCQKIAELLRDIEHVKEPLVKGSVFGSHGLYTPSDPANYSTWQALVRIKLKLWKLWNEHYLGESIGRQLNDPCWWDPRLSVVSGI